MATNSLNYIPQLIIGLDSLNDDANYIYIDHAKDDVNYYCPCCKGQIRPRAHKKNKNYKMQSHFYHMGDGCSEESYVHFICKTFLCDVGSKFIVDGIVYEVESFEVEKTLNTSFGDYRPDIIIKTTSGKIFYFEIKYSSKKTEHYIPKWDELGNDVVEVDVRYFINQKYNDTVPVFNLIYSDGECFIKSYVHKDYDNTLMERKRQWKRQDVLNYKIQWERLDWFWNTLQSYSKNDKNKDDVLESFHELEYDDKVWVYSSIKKKTCVDLKEEFLEDINRHFYDMLKSLETDEIRITVKHVSPKIYWVFLKTNFKYIDYDLYNDGFPIKVKTCNNGILSLVYKEKIINSIKNLEKDNYICKDVLKNIWKISNLPYVESIHPKSHSICKKEPFGLVKFIIKFNPIKYKDVYLKFDKSFESTYHNCSLTVENIEDVYKKYCEEICEAYDFDLFLNGLNENERFNTILERINNQIKYFDFKIFKVVEYHKIIKYELLDDSYRVLCDYEFSINDDFENSLIEFESLFFKSADMLIHQINKSIPIINEVNTCKNNLWKCLKFSNTKYKLELYDENKKLVYLDWIYIPLMSIDFKLYLIEKMNEFLKDSENYMEIRFLEER